MKKATAGLSLATLLALAPLGASADDCAGNVDATGNECNASPTVTARASEGDVKRLESEQMEARLVALKAAVKQREMKLAIAKASLVGAEAELRRAMEALEDEEKAQTRRVAW